MNATEPKTVMLRSYAEREAAAQIDLIYTQLFASIPAVGEPYLARIAAIREVLRKFAEQVGAPAKAV